MHFDIERISAPTVPVRSWVRGHRRWAAAIAGLAVLLIALVMVIVPPAGFPSSSYIVIPKDASADTFAATLADAQVIRSDLAFRLLARLSGYDRHLDPGAYVFSRPTTLLGVLWRVGHAQHGIRPVRVTLTEGMTRFDIATTLKAQLPGFDADTFLEESSTSEGYLFPETYFFMPGDSASAIVARLRTQFSESIAEITPEVMASKHPFTDAVIIASILEREANTPEDMRVVAGILWNRLDEGMPLQVDAAFGYARRQNGYTPTAEDLDSDSPYNTYRFKGLPPTPISNPGLEAIKAAVAPAKTKYFYYLTGKDGLMHYAVTFEEHKRNRAKYLDM